MHHSTDSLCGVVAAGVVPPALALGAANRHRALRVATAHDECTHAILQAANALPKDTISNKVQRWG